MPKPINRSRLTKVKPSATLEMSKNAKAMRRQGIDVKNLSAGEPDFNTPTCIIDVAEKALRDGLTKYTPSRGIPDLVDAIREKLKRDQGTDYAAEEVISTVGTKGALSLIFDALLDDGDEVIFFAPCWVTYPDLVRLAGGTPVFVETTYEDRWTPSPDKLRAAITDKTKAVVLCTPSNPTGMGIEKPLLEQLLAVVAETEAWVISDEIYERLTYDGYTHTSPLDVRPDLKDRIIIANGAAKAYAMTGWRLGYAAGPKHLIDGMLVLQQQRYSCAASASQAAAAYALREPDEVKAAIAEMVTAYGKRRSLVADHIKGIEGLRAHLPDGAFYFFVDVAARFPLRHPEAGLIETDIQLCQALLKTAHVATVPGTPFGGSGAFRTSFVTGDDELNQAFSRIAAFLDACD